MYTETTILGRYTKKLRSALVTGFFIFLISEIMLFGGLFSSYFTFVFQVTRDVFELSRPLGTELLRWYKTPILATVVLVTSGYTFNYTYYLYRTND